VAVQPFDAFRDELNAIHNHLDVVAGKTLRDDELVERIRNLFRAWATTVRPEVESHLNNKRDFFKLEGELQALAALTSKIKPVAEYRKRISRCLQFAHALVLFLPPSRGSPSAIPARVIREGLFLPEIPDLPLALVPNALLGWRGAMEEFLREFPFDRSVFVMIRYRDRNRALIAHIKTGLDKLGYNGILALDHNITDDLYNPIACLLCCSKGLAVFDEPEAEQAFNPNVAYELGMMHLLGRECRILKHSSLTALQTDILMKLYLAYATPEEVGQHLSLWLDKPS
jgi:hypothetical protein